MEKAREREDPETCHYVAPSTTPEGRVHMSAHEVVNRLVPGVPVGLKIRAIPPILIEIAITKSHQLRQAIQKYNCADWQAVSKASLILR